MTGRHRFARRPHGFALLVRSRRIAAWLIVAVLSTASLGALEIGLEVPDSSTALGLYAVTAVVTAAGPGLAGHDLDLDHAAARPWWQLRLAHAVIVAAVAYGLVTATGLTDHPLGTSGQVARNAAGLTGLLTLGAVTLGANRSWALPLLLAVAAPYLSHQLGTDPPAWAHAVVWPVEPPTSDAALAVALIVGGTGTIAYALAGPARTHLPRA